MDLDTYFSKHSWFVEVGDIQMFAITGLTTSCFELCWLTVSVGRQSDISNFAISISFLHASQPGKGRAYGTTLMLVRANQN